jgi:hypothetical protein
VNTEQIRNYMVANVDYHVDWKTNEVNFTTLAEDACDALNGYEKDGESIPEIYFDIAILVAAEKEEELNKGE